MKPDKTKLNTERQNLKDATRKARKAVRGGAAEAAVCA